MPSIVTANGVRVRCEAHKTFAVVLDQPAHSRFTGRYEAGVSVWEDVAPRAIVVFRSNDARAVAKRVNVERHRWRETRGPLSGTGVGVFHLPSGTWTVPTPERVDVRALAAR